MLLDKKRFYEKERIKEESWRKTTRKKTIVLSMISIPDDYPFFSLPRPMVLLYILGVESTLHLPRFIILKLVSLISYSNQST